MRDVRYSLTNQFKISKLIKKRHVITCCNPNLGVATKARACKKARQEGDPGGTSYIPGNAGECEIMNLHTPKATPTWGIIIPKDSWIFREQSQGSKPIIWRVLYIIENLLKRKCLKWARITHLDIWNTSYGLKKGRESNWQFESWPLKVRNQPDFLMCKWRATHHWKALNEGYNFSLHLISIKRLLAKLWGFKVVKVPTLAISGLPFGSPRSQKSFRCGPRGKA